MQYIRKNWFDIGTMMWAIALVAVATLWVASPAFARGGGGGGPDCWLWCEEVCQDDGCEEASIPGDPCWGKCNGDPIIYTCET